MIEILGFGIFLGEELGIWFAGIEISRGWINLMMQIRDFLCVQAFLGYQWCFVAIGMSKFMRFLYQFGYLIREYSNVCFHKQLNVITQWDGILAFLIYFLCFIFQFCFVV